VGHVLVGVFKLRSYRHDFFLSSIKPCKKVERKLSRKKKRNGKDVKLPCALLWEAFGLGEIDDLFV